MKLIKNKEFLRNIAHHIDLMNTVGGGAVETKVKTDKYKKGYVIRVSAPSVSPERYQVIIENNKLTIMLLHLNEENPTMQVPLFYQEFTLGPKVNISKIKAVFENGELQLRLPYYKIGPRRIDIDF